MGNRYFKILSLFGGLLLAVFGLLWAASVSFQGQLDEFLGPVVAIVSVGLFFFIIGWKE